MIPDTIFDIFKSIISLLITLFRQNKKIRTYIVIGLSIYITSIIFVQVFISEKIDKEVLQFLGGLGGVCIFLLLIALISYTPVIIDKDGLKVELDNIKQEREKIIERISKKNNNVIDTIQLSLNQITEYYTINLSQARSSYRWSITAIIIGLITLIAGAWLIFFQTTPNITVGIITGISGILIEFIGASNIYIYNKSLSQLNLYFRELINIQDTMLAIELCEKIDNSNPKKIEITEKIILSLMGRSSIRESLFVDFKNKDKIKKTS
jgi:thiosulfate reductase cytochrome b subunit